MHINTAGHTDPHRQKPQHYQETCVSLHLKVRIYNLMLATGTEPLKQICACTGTNVKPLAAGLRHTVCPVTSS